MVSPTNLPAADLTLDQLEQGTSLWSDAWHRLKKNRLALVGGIMLVTLTLLCVLGPFFTQSYQEQNLDLGAVGPSAAHWLGTDTLGRDLFARILYGGRISIMVGLVATFDALTIGVVYGAVAGFFGGKIDTLMMRIVDIMYALPFTIFVILLMVFFWAQHRAALRRHRRGGMADHGAHCSRPDHVDQENGIHRGRAFAWSRQAPHHFPAHDPQCARAHHRLHDADHPRGDAA